MIATRFILLLVLLPLASCVSRDAGTAAFGQTPDGPKFTGPGQQGTNVVPGSNMMDSPEGFTPEEDIVFTDPDNPDASLPELSGILKDPSLQRGPWERNIRVARKNSIREGKPLLIWFTDSNRSPRCRQLNQELFNDRDFQKWAGDNLIRMRVDEGEELKDDGLSLSEEQTLRTQFRKYVAQLKKHYKVLGYPSLVMIDPQGRVVGHYRGYKKGQADLTWGKLRQGVAISNAGYKTWVKQLESRGYREWKDQEGRTLIAKLVRYDKGKLHLVEPDGSRSTVNEKILSAADQRWILEQKKLNR